MFIIAENPIDRLICEMTLLLADEVTMYACYSLMRLLTVYPDKLATAIKRQQVKSVFEAMIAVSGCIRIDNYRIIKSWTHNRRPRAFECNETFILRRQLSWMIIINLFRTECGTTS